MEHRRRRHRQRHGGIRNTGKVLNCGESGKKKNGKVSDGGRNGKYSPLSPHFFLQKSCTFVVSSKNSPTDISECRARDER